MKSKIIKYSDHNFTAVISAYFPIGKKPASTKEGKPFLSQGKLIMGINDNLYQITAIKFFNSEGKEKNPETVPLDTDERICGVYIKDKRVLLLHRIKNGREYYAFPGGHRIIRETDPETLKRELKEELNLEIDNNIKMILTMDKEGFGKEKYYQVNITNPEEMFEKNADNQKGEVNEPVFLKISEAVEMNNVFPEEVIKKIAI